MNNFPDEIWECEISKFLELRDVLAFSLCSKKANLLSKEMFNNVKDEFLHISYENYIQNKIAIDSIRNIKKIIYVYFNNKEEENEENGNEEERLKILDIHSLNIISFVKLSCLDLSLYLSTSCNIKELNICNSILNETSIIRGNLETLERITLQNMNITSETIQLLGNIKHLELVNCIGLNSFEESNSVFRNLESLTLKYMRVDYIKNIQSLLKLELVNIDNTTLLYNLPNLKILKCVNCAINNIDYIESVETLNLSHCMNLTSIDSLRNLKNLYMERCNRIHSIKNLKRLENIHILKWSGKI